MALEAVSDYVAEGLDRLIDQYQDKPRLAGVLTSYLEEANELEAVFQQLLTERNVDNAVGVQLDILGKLVGQKRIGPDDESYRIFIRARIRANRSLGNPSDIIAVATLALNGLRFLFEEFYPASFVVDVLDPLPAFAAEIASLLRLAKPAGVGMDLHYTDDPEDETFAFADGDVEQDDEDRGFDDDTDTTGGRMISAI